MPKKRIRKVSPKKKTKKTKRLVLQSVKGMHDIVPADQPWWGVVRNKVDELADYYGFERIDTPIVEPAYLFEKGVGAMTDIVEKQMFFLKDSEKLVLRPEGTAAIARAYTENGLSHMSQPARLYYLGPMFRHEQPQEGRLRQFYQAGFEIIGADNDPIFDAQIILTFYRLLEALKLTRLVVQVNTIGCRVCRPSYRRRLLDYYKNKDVCSDCKRRLAVNPLRLLDCKDKKCEEIKNNAPTVLDSICGACDCHFKTVLEYLEEINLPYVLNHRLVRGLDYYNKTVFEIYSEGSDLALASGGRYDYLIEMLGGRSTPGVGGAMGIERAIALMKKKEVKLPALSKKTKIFLIHIGNLAKKRSLALIEVLKKSGIKVRESLGKDSLKSQLKQADKEKIEIVLIFGQREAFEETIIVRDMLSSSQETVSLHKLVPLLKKKL